MGLARVDTFTLDGVQARRVWVEADVRAAGCRAFTVVGLADKAVREARERVRAAITNCGFVFPDGAHHGQPRAGVPAQGRAGLRPAAGHRGPGGERSSAPQTLAGCAIAGELSLAGRGAADPRRAWPSRRARAGRASPGSSSRGARAREAALVERARGLGVGLAAGDRRGAARTSASPRRCRRRPSRERRRRVGADAPDLSDVRGHNGLSRRSRSPRPAATTCSCTGRRARARRCSPAACRGILPPLTADEAIEVTRHPLDRRACTPAAGWSSERPFRAPHHTISASGLVGGGSQPGARGGDARPPRRPLPRRAVRVPAPGARGAAPAARGRARDHRPRASGWSCSRRACMLVAATNPCPCGMGRAACRCSAVDLVAPPAPAERAAARPDRRLA